LAAQFFKWWAYTFTDDIVRRGTQWLIYAAPQVEQQPSNMAGLLNIAANRDSSMPILHQYAGLLRPAAPGTFGILRSG
jgi:hypothetical protein